MQTIDKCGSCEHMQYLRTCLAYPDPGNIPSKIYFGGEIHDKVEPDQIGDYVFTEKK
jgi:hypothetical protein